MGGSSAFERRLIHCSGIAAGRIKKNYHEVKACVSFKLDRVDGQVVKGTGHYDTNQL